MLKIKLHVALRPDPSAPGTRLAEVRELPGICTVIAEGEDPIPIIDDFLIGYFKTLAEIGQLGAVLASLLDQHSTPSSPSNFEWDWYLANENRRLHRENA